MSGVTQSMRKDKAILKSGLGSQDICLGQTEKQVRSILGKPNSIIRRLKGSYFYVYNELGVDLDFAKSGGKVKIVFWYREGCQSHKGAQVITDRGIELGDTRSKVLNLYGIPDKQGGPLMLPNGRYSGEWFFYQEGIQFELGSDRKVDVISVCPPTKDRRQKEAMK
jgi:hypothetical protein